MSYRFLLLGRPPAHSFSLWLPSEIPALNTLSVSHGVFTQPFLHWKRLPTVLEEVLSVIVSPVRTEPLVLGTWQQAWLSSCHCSGSAPPFPSRMLLVPHSLQGRLDSIFQMNIVSGLSILPDVIRPPEGVGLWRIEVTDFRKPSHVLWHYPSLAVSNFPLSDCHLPGRAAAPRGICFVRLFCGAGPLKLPPVHRKSIHSSSVNTGPQRPFV